jgi:hypothetical protein
VPTSSLLPGPPALDLGTVDLARSGYVCEEWLLTGRARSWAMNGRPRPDGRWTARPGATADYRTRLVVVRPVDPASASGTVLLEWMNVSGGLDVPTDWYYTHRHLLRTGATWVGVTAQRAGIAGGGLKEGRHLTLADPDRYRTLLHPGDAYAYDIFSQAAHSLRAGDRGPLAGTPVRTVLAAGESQSAIYLTTYANAIDPHDRLVDGFLLHGRGPRGAWVDGTLWNVRRMVTENLGRLTALSGHRIRDDVRVPVLTVQSETDVALLGSALARQPDSSRFRLWEIAGAAHFDTYGLRAGRVDDGSLTPQALHRALRPMTDPRGFRAPVPVNSGPQQHYVLQAAVDHLARWAEGGDPPPEAARLVQPLVPVGLARDEWGVARGGVRTPWVDAPATVLSGLGQPVAGFGTLFGTTKELSPQALVRRYPGGRRDFQTQFAAATDRAVRAGFLLAADAGEIAGLGRCAWPAGKAHP